MSSPDDLDPDETLDPPATLVIRKGEAMLQVAQSFHRLVNAVTEAEQIAVAIARQLDAQAARERLT